MNKYKYLTLIAFLFLGCNADKNELTIQDLKNNNVDTSTIATTPATTTTTTTTSDALGTQKISVTVVIGPTFSKTVTRVRVRAFTSRSPVVASSWLDLTASATAGTFTGTYSAAPNPSTKFGLHTEAYNGSAKVGELAGSEIEYANNGDGSTIVGNTITLTTSL
jgi:hypothetical protein